MGKHEKRDESEGTISGDLDQETVEEIEQGKE